MRWTAVGSLVVASLDYLRLASFEFNYANIMADLMSWYPGGWRPGRWLQYKGWKKETYFVGVGEQAAKRHMIISSSGSDSDHLAAFMDGYLSFYCTRIDIQRTIEKPKHAQLRRIQKSTKTNNCTLIESPENHTLYIGSRTSDLFTRLYEKQLDTMWLRLEFELKGARARAAWGGIVHGKTPHNIFSYYLRKSKLPTKVKSWFSEPADDDSFQANREEIVTDARKKLKWLWSLDECMERAMNDHEIGEEVKALVRGWSTYADKLDLDNSSDITVQ